MGIVPATTDDIDGIIEVLQATNLHVPVNDNPLVLAEHIGRNPRSILITRDKTTVVGCVFTLTSPWISVLYHLAVRPDYQNLHIGSRLLDAAVDEARKAGSPVLTLYIKPEEKHLETFYAKRGFVRDREYLSMDLLVDRTVR